MDHTTPPPGDSVPPPPPPPPPHPPRPDIPNYLVQSILVTLCCCLPVGVVAIVFSAQVNSKKDQGDIAGAWDASKKAKMWAWIAFGLGIFAWIIWIALNGLAVFLSMLGA